MIRQPSYIVRAATRAALVSAVLALSACSSSDDGDDGGNSDNTDTLSSSIGTIVSDTIDGSTQFVVSLGPDQEVPAVRVDGATGEANFIIDTQTGAASGSVLVSGLTGPAQMAHIHRGFAGQNGGVEVALVGNDTGTEWSIPDDQVFDAIQLDALNTGELYINIHTEANMGGEIRGQIVPTGVTVRTTELSGANEVPAVESSASGTGVVTVNPSTLAINATVITTGLTDATMAHIHMGVATENGTVAIGLEQDVDNSDIWRTPAGAALTTEQLDAFVAGGLYFNVHTPANPSGELRGQL